MRLGGLVIRGRNGVLWRWVRSFTVVNRHGEDVEVHELERPCRHCGTPFSITTKLPTSMLKSYMRRAKHELEVVLNEPSDRPIRNLQYANCERDRGHGTPLV